MKAWENSSYKEKSQNCVSAKGKGVKGIGVRKCGICMGYRRDYILDTSKTSGDTSDQCVGQFLPLLLSHGTPSFFSLICGDVPILFEAFFLASGSL